VSKIMGLITQIKRVFGAGTEQRFIHPDIGVLVYDGVAWRTPISSDLFVSLYSSRQGPNERLVKLASSVWSRLGEFEQAAREFIAASAQSYFSSLGKLGGVDFLFPDKAWVRQEGGAVQGLSTADPVFALSFELHGDRNVLEVVFVFERPVLVDYH
jgi:hypothetical protein